MLLPILAVPIFVPALIAGVKASAAALAGVPLDSMGDWLKIMFRFDDYLSPPVTCFRACGR